MFTIDFKEDWRAYVETELKALGFSYDKNIDISLNYLGLLKAQRRIPCPQPRKMYYAKTFSVPECHAKGFATLVEKISKGNNLRPYLSRGIDDITSIDGALDDFGTIHFHLGEAILPSGYVKRTKELAFAWITKEALYFIAVHEHGKGYGDVWFNTHFVQNIHDNWPELIARYRLDIKESELTPNERKNLRSNGYNTSISVSDGTVYHSPGGGFTSGGHTIPDYVKNSLVIRHLEYYEALVRQEEIHIQAFFGLTKDKPLTLRMSFDGSTFWIFEPTKQVILISGKLGWLWQSPNAKTLLSE